MGFQNFVVSNKIHPLKQKDKKEERYGKKYSGHEKKKSRQPITT